MEQDNNEEEYETLRLLPLFDIAAFFFNAVRLRF